MPEARLAGSPGVGLLFGIWGPSRRAQRHPRLGSDPTTSPQGGHKAPEAPRRASHLREPRVGIGQERSLGRFAAWPLRPRLDSPRLCARAPRGGNGPEFPRFRRHETAPPRHRAPCCRQREEASPRNTAKGHGKNGAPGGTRTPDPQVRSLMLYPAELPARVGLAAGGGPVVASTVWRGEGPPSNPGSGVG